jgi:hypothetical protein
MNPAAADPVRNGDRWRVAAIDNKTNRVAAERLTDPVQFLGCGERDVRRAFLAVPGQDVPVGKAPWLSSSSLRGLAHFHGKWRAATQWMLGGPSNSS